MRKHNVLRVGCYTPKNKTEQRSSSDFISLFWYNSNTSFFSCQAFKIVKIFVVFFLEYQEKNE
jgi:hypothetical protein